MKCPNCQSDKIRKNGHRRGKQNYHCQECDRQFIVQYTKRGSSREIPENCGKMYVNGLGFRARERVTDWSESQYCHQMGWQKCNYLARCSTSGRDSRNN